jgi:hypothetical protein
MSTLTDRLPGLLAAQREDGAAFDAALMESSRALDAGNRVAAEAHGKRADAILARIRARSRQMANLIDSYEAALTLVDS